jgi:Mrp family chromosome partitioning ATPase
MSKNFDLFQQIDRQRHRRNHEAFVLPSAPPQPPRLQASESVRAELAKLVHRLFLTPGSAPRQTVVFAGVEEGKGAAKVCAYAGDMLASQVSGSVCVVDANLRSPALHEIFGWGNGRGLAELVLDSTRPEDVAARLSDQLWLITAGSANPDSPVVTSELMRNQLAELRGQFDYVLIDSPPAGVYPDAASLAVMSDGIILVLQANSTRRDVARQVKDDLEAAGVRVLGAVLNDRTFPIPDLIYSKL